MNRREMIGGMVSASALVRATGWGAVAAACGSGTALAQGAVDVVERFGFVGDGRTDNYEAFHRLADHASRTGGGSYVFPAGTYYVARHRERPYGFRDRRFVMNAEYLDCDRLTLSGYGAKIVLNGRFHRSGRRGTDGLTVGIHTAVFMPFEFRRCRNLTISGFEMDGGNARMTRDGPVTEGYSHLIALNSCSDVLLQDLDLHHGQVDGIYLSDDVANGGPTPGRACRNIRLRNVKCRNNARGGLAVIQVFGLSAVECEFSGNGYPGGNYVYHPPGFGVDIEPDRAREGVDIDTKTGNLEFVRCNFYDNVSAILAAYSNSFKGYCRFIDCNTRNRQGDNHIIANWPGEGVLIEGGEHDAGPGCIYLSWQGQTGCRTTLRNLTIRSSNQFGLLHAFDGNLAVVEGCSLIGTHRTPNLGNFPFIAADPGRGRRNVFARNRIFLPAASKDRSQAMDVGPNIHHTDLTGNEYSTDLAIRGEYFLAAFDPSCSVRNERFRGRFPGPQDTIRPTPDHDSRTPYSRP